MRSIPVNPEEILSLFSGPKSRIKCADRFQAQDVRRVCRALDEPFEVVVSGSTVVVPSEHAGTVREYLAGKLDTRRYRRNMPANYYGDIRSIYERNLIYV